MASRLLSYHVYGQPDQPAILLLHGFLGCKEDWEQIASCLSHDHYVVAVDLPGHGGSIEGFSEQDYSMTGCAQLLADLLDSLKISRCSILGYSMGGRLALYFAIHHPQRCTAVVLESASPGLRTESERTERSARDNALADRLLAEPLDRFLNDWYAQPLFEQLRKIARFHELLQRRRHNNPKGLALSLRNMGTGVQPSLWDSLSAINLPLLLLTGGLDTKFTQIAHEMAAQCPQCRIEVMDGSGHTLHFETPDRYIAAVQKFLMERK